MLRSGVAFGAFRTMLIAGITAPGVLAPALVEGASAIGSCESGLDLKGDRQEVAALSRALTRYRAGSPAAGRCRSADGRAARWAVTVSRARDRLTLEIADGSGASVVRTVSGVDVAAAVVDSWMHGESGAVGHAGSPRAARPRPAPGAIAVRVPRHSAVATADATPAAAVVNQNPPDAAPAAASPAAPPAAPPAPAPAAAAAPEPRSTAGAQTLRREYEPAAVRLPRSALTVTIGPEVSIASGGGSWLGAAAGACAPVGRFCAGILARGGAGAAIVGDPGTTRQSALDVYGTLDLPISLGRVTLVPGFGLGAGLLRADTSDPGSPAGEPSGDRTATTAGARAMARVALAIPVRGRWGVDVGSAFDVAVPARAPASDGQGGLYPAEPRTFLRGGVALRYGIP